MYSVILVAGSILSYLGVISPINMLEAPDRLWFEPFPLKAYN